VEQFAFLVPFWESKFLVAQKYKQFEWIGSPTPGTKSAAGKPARRRVREM